MSEPVDTAPFVGHCRRSDQIQIEVADGADGLEASFVTAGDAAERVPSFTSPLTYAGGTTFRMILRPMTEPIAATFVPEDDSGGPAAHLAIGLRVAPRV